jgi:hypothetical protein
VDSERAWKSLFPIGRGFVLHPELAKEEKTVSVFHELHCLVCRYNLPCSRTADKTKHSIRNAYFTYAYLLSRSHNTTSSSVRSRTDESHVLQNFIEPFVPNTFLEQRITSPTYADSLKSRHMSHCFDYLRQALMCAADSNLEDTITLNGTSGTTGMGSTRVCRSFDALKNWSEKWRSTDSDGVV